MPEIYKNKMLTRHDIRQWTDSYFTNTMKCVDEDAQVTYAVFLRHDCLFAPEMATGWLRAVAREGNFDVVIQSPYREGDLVPAGEPLLYITGSFYHLAECEPFILQNIGVPCVAALNAYNICKLLPDTPFIAMGARHCAGVTMQEMMDYAASVGGNAAKRNCNAKGFINGASDATAHFFGENNGMGTMPHALIGYCGGSTLEAAKLFRKKCPDKPFIILVDYAASDIGDALAVAQFFPDEAEKGELGFRLDIHGGRYCEGLDYDRSVSIIRRYAPNILNKQWNDIEENILYGPGVSVASILYFKQEMDRAGFPNVKIIASSGFDEIKCRMMAIADVQIDAIGTGAYIPKLFHQTYATADIIKYNDDFQVKQGRENLIQSYKQTAKENCFKAL